MSWIKENTLGLSLVGLCLGAAWWLGDKEELGAESFAADWWSMWRGNFQKSYTQAYAIDAIEECVKADRRGDMRLHEAMTAIQTIVNRTWGIGEPVGGSDAESFEALAKVECPHCGFADDFHIERIVICNHCGERPEDHSMWNNEQDKLVGGGDYHAEEFGAEDYTCDELLKHINYLAGEEVETSVTRANDILLAIHETTNRKKPVDIDPVSQQMWEDNDWYAEEFEAPKVRGGKRGRPTKSRSKTRLKYRNMSKAQKRWVSDKIKTIMRDWKQTGRIGNSRPTTTKAAQRQAIAVAYSMATKRFR